MSRTSLFELFKIGIGPSSSHTVGPMVAAKRFSTLLNGPSEVVVELHGSLALTGEGHGTDTAIILGLAGQDPETVDVELVANTAAGGDRDDLMSEPVEIRRIHQIHPAHANVMRFSAASKAGTVDRWYASIGGGFVVELEDGLLAHEPSGVPVPHPFHSASDLLRICDERSSSVAAIMRENERVRRSDQEIDDGIRRIVQVMWESIDLGMRRTGTLPGLGVRRRARDLALQLSEPSSSHALPPTEPSDWAGVFATAVNEENASGGRIVTAPTNGAAGIVPATLRFLIDFCEPPVEDPDIEFMLTAAAIGSLIKANAGISGAELGCQGEVGSACAMAAAGLTAALGGSPAQVENAAEIAMEHNLGLTCDPVGGFVQVPCIERNAIGTVKAISASSLALRGDGVHVVPLDVAIETMRQTGADMNHKYKETSLGGLAVNVPAC